MMQYWLYFFILLVLALWYLSYRVVLWDTRRRHVRPIERKAWIAAAIFLPLFGCALYLFAQVLGRYLTPTLNKPDSTEQNADIFIPSTNSGREEEITGARPGNRQSPEDLFRDTPVPEPAWGDTKPAHSNGKAHTNTAPETIRAPYQPIQTQFSLYVIQGPLQGQLFLLKSFPLRIGRGPEAGIALDADLNVSRKHAEIYEWNGRLRIRDLGSLHGIQVNGITANDQALSPGDRITLGNTVLVLREIS